MCVPCAVKKSVRSGDLLVGCERRCELVTCYGHTKEDARTKQTLPKDEWQLLQDHLSNVARLSAERAGKFGAAQLGNLIGLTHDLGK